MSIISDTDSRLVLVNSLNRLPSSISETDFLFNVMLPYNDYDRVCVTQIGYPRNYYDVDQYTNTFTLTELGTSVTVTLPIGWYNVNTMLTEVVAQLNTASPHTWTYACTYPTYGSVSTNKFTFTVTGNSGNQPTFSFNSDDCYNQLGFYVNSVNVFSGSTLTSTTTINISYINKLFLQSTICSEDQNNLLLPLLAPGTVPNGAFLYYQETQVEANSRKFTNTKDNIFHFQVFDEYGNIILNNGMNFAFTLLFYKKENINSLMRKHLEAENLEKLMTIS